MSRATAVGAAPNAIGRVPTIRSALNIISLSLTLRPALWSALAPGLGVPARSVVLMGQSIGEAPCLAIPDAEPLFRVYKLTCCGNFLWRYPFAGQTPGLNGARRRGGGPRAGSAGARGRAPAALPLLLAVRRDEDGAVIMPHPALLYKLVYILKYIKILGNPYV